MNPPCPVSGSRKALYDNLCLRINIDEETNAAAWTLLEKFYTLHPSGQEYELIWPVCAIYIVASKCLSPTTQSGIPLSQLLRDSNTSLYDFFAPLKVFLSTLQLDVKIVERLQLKYVVVTLLYEKYRQLFSKLFVIDLESISKRPSYTPRKGSSENIFRLGWFLFLMAKGNLFSNSGDFVQCLHLLLCCVNLLIMHVPEGVAKLSLKEILDMIEQKMSSSQPADALLYLCNTNYANHEQVKDLQEKIFNPWLNKLCVSCKLRYQQGKLPPDKVTMSNTIYLPGLLEGSLDENVKLLNGEYEMFLYETCDFDERLFLEGHQQIQSPLRPPTPQFSFNRMGPSMTPAKAALSANDWLVKTVTPLEEGPNSTILMQFFAGHGQSQSQSQNQSQSQSQNQSQSQTQTQNQDPSKEDDQSSGPGLGTSLAPGPGSGRGHSQGPSQDLLTTIITRVTSLMQHVTFQAENFTRKQMVTKLYYHLLDAVLTEEIKRVSIAQCGALLSHDLFHKSLLACCLEIVVCSYRESQMKFPWILQKFEIAAFDFYTIVECVIKNEPRLPHPVRSHLIRIEEQVLEELGWEANSPVFTGLNNEQRKLLRSRLENTAGTPKKIHKNACLTFSSPTKATTGRIHKKVEFFLRKVAHLASLRIHELCRELLNEGIKINSEIVQQIEYIFMYVLTQTLLIQNRHIDQLIMCVLYAVCKMNQIPITFKQIVEKYLSQPQANSLTYRNVHLSDPNEFGDIIKFYNVVFLRTAESFLMEFTSADSSAKGEDHNKENESDTEKNLSTTTPFISYTSQNLLVASPLRFMKSPHKMQNLLISPRRTPLLLRGQSPSDSLVFGPIKTPRSNFEQINTAINKTSTKAKRKLDYSLFQDIPSSSLPQSKTDDDSGSTPGEGIPPVPRTEFPPRKRKLVDAINCPSTFISLDDPNKKPKT